MSQFSARPKRSRYKDVTSLVAQKKRSVVEVSWQRLKKDVLVKRIVLLAGPGAVNCANKTGTPGITMHYFPKDETLRQKWTRFVRIHRKDFVSTKSSALCSANFDETCFHSKSIAAFDASGNPVNQKRRLILGSIPSKDTVVPYTSPLTSRKRRMVSRQQ